MRISISLEAEGQSIFRVYEFPGPDEMEAADWNKIVPDMLDTILSKEGLDKLEADDIEQIGADEEREMRRMDAQDQRQAILKNFKLSR